MASLINDEYSNENLEDYFSKVLKKLKEREIVDIKMSGLQKIHLPDCKSKIVKKNNGQIFVFRINGFAGIFKKDSSMGEDCKKNVNCFFCDALKEKNEAGMLTTDELPSYGIKQKEKNIICEELNLLDKDVGIIFCLDEQKSHESRDFLISKMMEIFSFS